MDTNKLTYMANQIAKNFAAQGHEEAVAATANHITQYWDPRMKSEALDLLASHPGDYSEISRAALAKLGEMTGENADRPD